LGGILVVALWAASAAQVVAGRTDRRRGHRILSRVLWCTLFGSSAFLATYSSWFLAVSPADLGGSHYEAAANGPWVQVAGWARPYLALADLEGPRPRIRETTISTRTVKRTSIALSRGGARLAALEEGILRVFDLSDGRLLLARNLFDRGSLELAEVSAAFVTEDHVRLYRDGSQFDVHDVDIRSGEETFHFGLRPEDP